MPIAILVLSKFAGGAGFLFGWAKPVPVNYSALRDPRAEHALGGGGGPGANLVMALGWALLLKVDADLLPAERLHATPLRLMCEAGIEVNLVLMLLNLLPILPLDGGRIVASLLPARMAWRYAKLEPWGFPILLLLMFAGYARA